MMELLYKLFVGHLHKWEIIDRKDTNLFRHAEDKMPYQGYTTYTSKCEVCGKIKQYKVNK